ncbi:hypothetical protein JCM8547_005444 [Rhodosporidiobolus lusitaniae]
MLSRWSEGRGDEPAPLPPGHYEARTHYLHDPDVLANAAMPGHMDIGSYTFHQNHSAPNLHRRRSSSPPPVPAIPSVYAHRAVEPATHKFHTGGHRGPLYFEDIPPDERDEEAAQRNFDQTVRQYARPDDGHVPPPYHQEWHQHEAHRRLTKQQELDRQCEQEETKLRFRALRGHRERSMTNLFRREGFRRHVRDEYDTGRDSFNGDDELVYRRPVQDYMPERREAQAPHPAHVPQQRERHERGIFRRIFQRGSSRPSAPPIPLYEPYNHHQHAQQHPAQHGAPVPHQQHQTAQGGGREPHAVAARLRAFAPWRRRHTIFGAVGVLFLFIFLRRSSSSHIPFHHPISTPTGNTTWSPSHTTSQRIPPYVHYVFGLSPTFGGKPFNFIHWLCMTSALVVLKPEIIYMHYVYEPDTWYWRRFVWDVEQSGTTRLEMVKERDVTQVFGQRVEHFAHKADVLRLEALRNYGGIYLDIDVLVVKDLAPLYRHEVVMAMESQPNLDPKLPPSGLCNAVILAKPYSSFVSRWIESYRSFNGSSWAGHSVTTPWDLARAYPTEITVLNKFAFFWPIWHDDHLRVIHRSDKYSFHRPDPLAPTYDEQFTYHLWESVAYDRYLSPYDPDRIHNRGKKHGKEREEDGASDENSFSKEARRFVSNEFRIAWRAAVERGDIER